MQDCPQSEEVLSYFKILEGSLANVFQIHLMPSVWPRVAIQAGGRAEAIAVLTEMKEGEGNVG